MIRKFPKYRMQVRMSPKTIFLILSSQVNGKKNGHLKMLRFIGTQIDEGKRIELSVIVKIPFSFKNNFMDAQNATLLRMGKDGVVCSTDLFFSRHDNKHCLICDNVAL